MRILTSLLCAVVLIAAPSGCNTKKSGPGGGAESATQFKLRGPQLATTVKRGETQTIDIDLDRGKDFKQSVKLQAEAPAGVEVAFTDAAIDASEKGNFGLKVTTHDKAALGDQVIKVTANPETGSATALDVKIKVADHAERAQTGDNPTVAVKAPLLSTPVKQGETQTVNISLSRGNAKSNVHLKVNAPKGIDADLTSSTVTAKDTGDLGLKLTAEKDAPLGEHIVTVSGTADGANVTPADVKVNVIAKE